MRTLTSTFATERKLPITWKLLDFDAVLYGSVSEIKMGIFAFESRFKFVA